MKVPFLELKRTYDELRGEFDRVGGADFSEAALERLRLDADRQRAAARKLVDDVDTVRCPRQSPNAKGLADERSIL